jgi:prepilin-type N-terminal cleavage/methylation domain-containing protein
MPSRSPDHSKQSGFTLIELLVVLVIIAILFGLTSVNLGHAQSSASLASVTNTLLADIKNQQILAMSGEQGSTTHQQPHGIYLQPDSYTLFADESYNGSDTNNFTVTISPDTLATTFPGNQLLFEVGDGAVSGFSSGNNTITITDQGGSEMITINRYGATSVN